jgi:hypothetical protein
LLGLLSLAVAPSARASHPVPGAGGLTEAELRAAEIGLLGPEHAAEHARGRAAQAEESRRLSPAERRRIAAADRREAEAFASSTESAGPAGKVGRWTRAPFEIPHAAINAALLPTGEVFFYGNSFPDEPINRGNGAIWKPSKGYGSDAFTEVPPPRIDPDGSGPQERDRAPLFCSGLSMLPSGEILVTGGNLVWPDQYDDDPYTGYAGLNRVFTFNPWTRSWREQPRLNSGHWYPGQVELADGRTVILGGFTHEAPGGILGRDLEVFTPAASPGGVGSLALQPSAQRRTALYPHLITLPDSSVLLAGPGRSDSARLRTTDFTWIEYPHAPQGRTGGNAVLNPGSASGSWQVTQIGGYDQRVEDAEGNHAASASTATLDALRPWQSGGWKNGPSLNVPRAYQNTVLLPNGSMVTLGGGIGNTVADQNYAIDPGGAQRQVELYDPATKTWSLGPAAIEDRGYHATALLLPNGRVWSAGDEKHPLEPGGGWALTDTAEIYSPPYLFRGPRPRILSAPRELRWADEFQVQVDSSVPAKTAVLVAPGATTHGADYGQRVVKLAVRATYDGGIDLVAPPRASVAPPGHYMLFVLNQGVPSVAKWVELTADAPDAP